MDDGLSFPYASQNVELANKFLSSGRDSISVRWKSLISRAVTNVRIDG